jgi:hypothetical protein
MARPKKDVMSGRRALQLITSAPADDVKTIERLVAHVTRSLAEAWSAYDHKTMVGFVRGSPGCSSAKLAVGTPAAIEALLDRAGHEVDAAARAVIRDALDQTAREPTSPEILRSVVAWNDEAKMYFVRCEPTGKARLN